MANWKVGDVVVLKSGGPTMTVENIRPSGKVDCSWFKAREKCAGLFASEALKRSPKGGQGKTVSRG